MNSAFSLLAFTSGGNARPWLMMLGCCTVLPGCYAPPMRPQTVTPRPATSSTFSSATLKSAVVLTRRDQLAHHVGEIVTLKGEASPGKMPFVLGVPVQGDFRLGRKMVTATGKLTSYEVTAEDVAAFDEQMRKAPFAAPQLTEGTHYALRDPNTGELVVPELCETEAAN